MPAIPDEIEEAGKEGVDFIFQAAPVKITGNRKTQGINCLKTEPGNPMPAEGEARCSSRGPVFPESRQRDPGPGGEGGSLVSSQRGGGRKRPDRHRRLGENEPCRFLRRGDAATGEGYVSRAIASGKKGAQAIDHYLRGKQENPQEDHRKWSRWINSTWIISPSKTDRDFFPRLEREGQKIHRGPQGTFPFPGERGGGALFSAAGTASSATCA